MNQSEFVKIPKTAIKKAYNMSANTGHILTMLFTEARYLPGIVDGISTDIGQALISINDSADMLNIARTTYRYCLKRLEEAGLIKTEKVNKKYTRVTLVDYYKSPSPSTMLKGYIAK